jgi:hypothetical protein
MMLTAGMKKVVDMLKSPENGFGGCRSPPCDFGFGVAGIRVDDRASIPKNNA